MLTIILNQKNDQAITIRCLGHVLLKASLYVISVSELHVWPLLSNITCTGTYSIKTYHNLSKVYQNVQNSLGISFMT